MKHYRIYTPYGHWYQINEAGKVYKCDNGLSKDPNRDDGHQWDIIGGTSTHPFAGVHLIPIATLAQMSSKELLYKNRSPRYTIVDIDHGTRRVHGNSKYHGIESIETVIV